MVDTAGRGALAILITLAVALMLMVFPLPDWAQPFRAQWPLMVLAYWCMAIPITSTWTNTSRDQLVVYLQTLTLYKPSERAILTGYRLRLKPINQTYSQLNKEWCLPKLTSNKLL